MSINVTIDLFRVTSKPCLSHGVNRKCTLITKHGYFSFSELVSMATVNEARTRIPGSAKSQFLLERSQRLWSYSKKRQLQASQAHLNRGFHQFYQVIFQYSLATTVQPTDTHTHNIHKYCAIHDTNIKDHELMF